MVQKFFHLLSMIIYLARSSTGKAGNSCCIGKIEPLRIYVALCHYKTNRSLSVWHSVRLLYNIVGVGYVAIIENGLG